VSLFDQPLGKQKLVRLSATLIRRIQDYDYDRSGGFQGHTKKVLKRIEDGVLAYDDEFLGQTWRYAWRYGEGGWQNVCRSILSEIQHSVEP
jgi:hypothetical protein